MGSATSANSRQHEASFDADQIREVLKRLDKIEGELVQVKSALADFSASKHDRHAIGGNHPPIDIVEALDAIETGVTAVHVIQAELVSPIWRPEVLRLCWLNLKQLAKWFCEKGDLLVSAFMTSAGKKLGGVAALTVLVSLLPQLGVDLPALISDVQALLRAVGKQFGD